MQAIVLATRNGAEHLGIEKRKGLVKEGMEADLILLEKDPAEDISNIQFIEKYSRRATSSSHRKRFHPMPCLTIPIPVMCQSYSIKSPATREVR